MLSNRGMNAAQCAEGLPVEIDLDALVRADQELPFEDVIALAARFKKTWPYLLIDSPEVLKYGRDNRTFANRATPLSAELVDQHARVEAMLQWAGELFPEIAVELPAKAIGTGTRESVAANVIRQLLGVSYDEQVAANGSYGALRLWSEALQNIGVYVQMRRLDDPTVRAFSIVAGEQAAVVADTRDLPIARVFSLLHEYVHVVLRSAGICDLDDQEVIERYCNAVAALVLMPTALVRRELPPRARWGESVADDEDRVSGLASKLGVSKASLLIRLRQLNVLSDGAYEVLEERRAGRPGADDSKGGGNYHRNAINKVGRRFASRVIGAYESRTIDRRDASAMLEIPEHNLSNFTVELAQAGGRS